jgi:hypothetical protein
MMSPRKFELANHYVRGVIAQAITAKMGNSTAYAEKRWGMKAAVPTMTSGDGTLVVSPMKKFGKNGSWSTSSTRGNDERGLITHWAVGHFLRSQPNDA